MKNAYFYTILFLIILLFTGINKGESQVLINSTGGTPDASAMLQIDSDSKGLLIPRLLTSQRTTLASTAVEGLIVFDTDDQAFYVFGSGAWKNLSVSAEIWSQNATDVYLYDLTKKVGIGTNVSAANTKLHVLQSGTSLVSQALGTVACFQQDGETTYWSRVSIIGGNEGASVLDLGDADNQQSGELLYDHTDNFMTFYTDNTEKLRITSSGNVGIGTDVPECKLDVRGADIDNGAFFSLSNSDQSHCLYFYSGSQINPNSFFIWKEGDDLRIGTDQGDFSEKMRITSSGNVGIGTNTPEATAVLDLTSTDKGFLPPRMDNQQREDISTPVAGLMIFNTDDNKMQMFNGTFWKNLEISDCYTEQPGAISGNSHVAESAKAEVYSISAVPEVSSYTWDVPTGATIVSGQGTTSITVDFGTRTGLVSVYATNGCGDSNFKAIFVEVGPEIGDFLEGGIVFWLDGNCGGLVCAVSDQHAAVSWGCYPLEIEGADGSDIGHGAQNTLDIEAGCTTPFTAADICANLSLNGYSDWFLPSEDELREMCEEKEAIDITALANGGTAFFEDFYWSSTEYYDFEDARSCDFLDCDESHEEKHLGFRVRAVRAF